jgi:hypothetical protein
MPEQLIRAYFGLVIGLLTIFATHPTSAEIGPVIALPNEPFVVPLPEQRHAPRPYEGVTTQLYNNARLGANLAETLLNPNTVAQERFGLLHYRQVQGQVLAQPLYLRDADFGGVQKSLVIVATAANIVYALDAEDLSVVRQIQLTQSVVGRKDVFCAETYPPIIGITSTPVIDPASGSVFVEAFNPITNEQELHVLNLHDGFTSDRRLEIIPPGLSAADANQWSVSHRNRAALLLSKGVVYIAFASFICDNPQPYAGWVLGYRTSDLKLVASWQTPNSVPNPFPDPPPMNSGSSGIWQSGRGLVASDNGDIYLMTGNDSNFALLENPPPVQGDFTDPRLANSFVKLTPGGPLPGLTVTGSFSPKNSSNLSAGDSDLGSSGPILLPGNRIAGGGKQGRVYVLDAATMHSLQDHDGPGDEGFQGFQAFFNNYHTNSLIIQQKNPSCTSAIDGGNPDRYCRQLFNENLLTPGKCPYQNPKLGDFSSGCYLPPSCYQYCQSYGPNIHAGFAYWPLSATHGWLYAMPEKEFVKAFNYDVVAGKIEETPVAISGTVSNGVGSGVLNPDGMPGGALSISANGTQDGIVWVSKPNFVDSTMGVHQGSLVALDATDLKQLWIDPCIWYFAKFNPPTIADGRVYLATFADPAAIEGAPYQPDCTKPEPALAAPYVPNPAQPPGFAYILEYGRIVDMTRGP